MNKKIIKYKLNSNCHISSIVKEYIKDGFSMCRSLHRPAIFVGFLLLTITACQAQETAEVHKESEEITTLPLREINLNDLTAFRSPGDNWIIAGEVQSDYKTRQSIEVIDGTGVLVTQGRADVSPDIFTEMEHGDLELKLEFLNPLGTNSGIYFQGRYEISILDTWRVEDLKFLHLGGIYQRWDETRPDYGERGYEGTAPTVNAALAPGLWQEYHIIFRAPKFDESGNKTENARFERVYLNGVLVQEDKEVTGPTRAPKFNDEAPLGPLVFQDLGPVAFRNIRYKTYSQTDSITLGQLNYTVYDYQGDRTPVDFENLEVIAEGVTDHFNISELSPQNEHYATVFSGKFEVPVTGDYLFETQMNNGGNLYIDGELVIENSGEINSPQRQGNIIHLTEGSHQIEVTHFQKIWSTSLMVNYEGPNIEKRPLVWQPVASGGRIPQPPVIVNVSSKYPELIGGFFNYENEKRTHVISVGQPEGIHYSYDLNNSTLLSFWRDPFADVTRMWQGRGHEQMLVLMNVAVESCAGTPLVSLGGSDTFTTEWPKSMKRVDRYRLNENGQPVFITEYNDILIEDLIAPDETGNEFIRTLRFQSDAAQNDKAARLAQGKTIELLSNGLYRVNGKYYLDLINVDGGVPEIYENSGIQMLVIPVLRNSTQSEIGYQLIW